MTNAIGDEAGSVTVFIIVPGGGWIELWLCKELFEQLIFITPLLDEAEEYEIQDIVLPEFWRPLPHGKRHALGRVLAHWVREGKIGLEFVGCPRCNRKRYRRSA